MRNIFEELANYMIIEGELLFTVYLWLVGIDIFTGVATAIKSRTLFSKVGLNGMIRHIIILVLVVVSTTFLYHMNQTTIAHGVQLYIIGFYGLSVVENIDMIGGNFLPDWIEDFFIVLKDNQNFVVRKQVKNDDLEEYYDEGKEK